MNQPYERTVTVSKIEAALNAMEADAARKINARLVVVRILLLADIVRAEPDVFRVAELTKNPVGRSCRSEHCRAIIGSEERLTKLQKAAAEFSLKEVLEQGAKAAELGMKAASAFWSGLNPEQKKRWSKRKIVGNKQQVLPTKSAQ